MAIQDLLRVSDWFDLSQAEARFAASLALDPDNVTAHQRLGQIALARGELDNARDHLLATNAVSPRRRPVRQMLGEIIAVQGYLEQAAELRHVKNFDSGQLDGRRFWYEQENDGTAFARLVAAIQAWQANKLAQ